MLAICNGGQRSGSTLQFNLTRSLLELAGKGSGGDFFKPGQLTASEIDLMIEQEQWTVIKAHHVEPAILYAASRTSRCVVLYTYRDLRDVAVSAQRFWGMSWDDVLTLLRQLVKASEELESHQYVRSQRYESLVSLTRSAIKEIAIWLEVPLTDALIEEVLKSSSTESAQRAIASIPLRQRAFAYAQVIWRLVPRGIRYRLRATSLGSRLMRGYIRHSNVVDPSTQLHPRHISKSSGQPGTWRNVLTATQVHEIESMFGDWLVAHDYELSVR